MKTLACSLLLGVTIFSQPVFAADEGWFGKLKQQFRQYWQTQQPEKLYLHTDRTFFVAADTVWFKAYAAETRTNQLRQEPEIAYLNLISPQNQSVVSQKLRLENGRVAGNFVLPDSLKSGRYLLQLYGNRQRSANPETFFRQPLYVNTAPQPETVAANPKKGVQRLGFYPESGKLVTGAEGKVAFKALAADNSVVPVEGEILDETGKLVTRFSSAGTGPGSFKFRPQPNKTYTAQIQNSPEKRTFPLPGPQKGYALSVKNQPDSVYITVAASPENLTAPVYLALQSHGSLLYSDSVRVNANGFRKLVFRAKNWPEGVVQATLFNVRGIAEAERLFFQQQWQPEIKLETAKKTFSRREAVELQLAVLDQNGKPLEGQFSVSVTMNDRVSGLSLRNSLLLASEVSGTFPEGYADMPQAETLDDLLLTRKPRHFSWEKVMQTEMPQTTKLQEQEPVEETGKSELKSVLVRKPVNKPDPAAMQEAELNETGKAELNGAPVSKAVIYFLETQTGYTHLATTNEEGKFKVPLVASSRLFYQVWQNGRFLKAATLRLEPSVNLLPATDATATAFVPDSTTINKLLLQKRIESIYGLNVKKPKLKIPVKDMWPTYPADKYYPLEEYNAFTNMEEIFKEIVPNVRLLTKNKVTETRIYNSDSRDFFPHQPLYIIDGQPTWNNDLFLRLDASQVDQVNVYYSGKSLAPFGFLGNQGVIAVYTKSANYQSPELQTEHIIKVTAQNGGGKFTVPVRGPHEPDFRPTLYWNPAITTNAEGKATVTFRTSDEVGEMQIRVEGITKEGKLVSQKLMVPVQAGE
jgi:hypothetical protein